MSETPDSTREMDELLHALWKNNYPILLERLKLIREAQDKLAAGLLDDRTRKEGEDAAHKLAGILGTFGLPRGSVLASKIEGLLAIEGRLAGDASSHAERAAQLESWFEELEAVIASRG